MEQKLTSSLSSYVCVSFDEKASSAGARESIGGGGGPVPLFCARKGNVAVMIDTQLVVG